MNDFLCVIIVLKNYEEVLYVNKYGKLMFGDLLCYGHYWLGPFSLSYTQNMADIASVMVPGGIHWANHFIVKLADGSHLRVHKKVIYNIVMKLLLLVNQTIQAW